MSRRNTCSVALSYATITLPPATFMPGLDSGNVTAPKYSLLPSAPSTTHGAHGVSGAGLAGLAIGGTDLHCPGPAPSIVEQRYTYGPVSACTSSPWSSPAHAAAASAARYASTRPLVISAIIIHAPFGTGGWRCSRM